MRGRHIHSVQKAYPTIGKKEATTFSSSVLATLLPDSPVSLISESKALPSSAVAHHNEQGPSQWPWVEFTLVSIQLFTIPETTLEDRQTDVD